MKLKAAITKGAPESVVEAMGSVSFAMAFLREICVNILGAENVLIKPAEYYIQEPDVTVNIGGGIGVELRLTGVSRNGRTAKQFHHALNGLHDLATETIRQALVLEGGAPPSIQLFTVLMLDGDVETSPGSGVYSSVLEASARRITIRGHVDLATTEA